MPVETDIKTAINSLLAGGCHTVVNASSTITLPYAVVSIISAIPANGVSGYLGLTEYTVQIDVIARTLEHAKSLSLGAIKNAIVGSSALQGTLSIHLSGEYSEVDKTHQYITEYQIWAA